MSSLTKGEVAVVLMAAGQGSRLGFDSPKGMYQPQLLSQKSILGVVVNRLARLQ